MYADEDSLDENFLSALRRIGVDVRTAAEEHMRRSSDAEQIEHAKSMGRVVYTSNVGDFCRLHREYAASARSHSGILIIRQNVYGVGELVRRVLNLQAARTSGDMVGQLEYLSNW